MADTEFEIPDSDEDDEDYGWAEEDEEELPPPPPQWQGSEDVLGPDAEEEKEEFEKDEELDELADEGPRDSRERRNEILGDIGRFDGESMVDIPTVEPEDVREGRAMPLVVENSDSEDELAL